MKKQTLTNKINLLRAGVMGANDGILSVAGIIIGVAGATTNTYAIFLAGISGLLAGTVSMAMGEWVSVSSQHDAERDAISQEQQRLDSHFEQEVLYIQQRYEQLGISTSLAHQAAEEMLAHDSLVTGVRERYDFDPLEKTSAVGAAFASFLAFPTGSLLPLGTMLSMPLTSRIPATVLAVIIALALTGYAAARLGQADPWSAIKRNVVSGSLTMMVTYLIGLIVGR